MRIKYPKAIGESEEELMSLEQHLRGQKTADRVRSVRIAFLVQARSVADTRKVMEQMVRLARESA